MKKSTHFIGEIWNDISDIAFHYGFYSGGMIACIFLKVISLQFGPGIDLYWMDLSESMIRGLNWLSHTGWISVKVTAHGDWHSTVSVSWKWFHWNSHLSVITSHKFCIKGSGFFLSCYYIFQRGACTSAKVTLKIFQCKSLIPKGKITNKLLHLWTFSSNNIANHLF